MATAVGMFCPHYHPGARDPNLIFKTSTNHAQIYCDPRPALASVCAFCRHERCSKGREVLKPVLQPKDGLLVLRVLYHLITTSVFNSIGSLACSMHMLIDWSWYCSCLSPSPPWICFLCSGPSVFLALPSFQYCILLTSATYRDL